MKGSTAARIGIEIGAAFSGNFKAVFGAANGEVQKIGSSIKALEARQKELNATIKEQEKLGAKGSPLKALYSQQEIDGITRKIAKLRTEQERLTAAGAGMQRGKSMMANAGLALGAVTAAAATAGAPIVQAASFESAMLGVAKQVEGARDESGKLTNVYYDMAKQIQMLGREIPIATNDLAAMVAAGARMGVAKDELIQFTRTASMMSEAFELPAAELADQMGKIAGLYKIPIPAIGGLADTINYLDDNAISKGGDIIDFMSRVGGVAGAIKITDKEVAALGSTLLTLGERTETAGTATNAMFQKFAAADKGTKKFKAAMSELGLSTAEVQKGMQQDSMGTMLKVLDSVAKLDPEQRLGVLTELVGLEHSDTLAKLAGNTGELRKQLAMANSEMAKGSMQKEFAARLETTNAQWEMMKNRVTEVSVNLGSVLLPAVNQVMGAIGSVTSGIAEFVTENKTLVGNIITVVGTLGGLFAATKIAALGIGAITFAFHALKLAMMTNPIGLALTALTVAGVLLWKNWDAIKDGMVAIWNTVRDTAIAAFDAIKSSVGAVIDWLAEKTAWIFQTVDKVKAAANSIGDGIGGAWSGAKNLVGLGPDTPAAGATAAAAGVAAVPASGGNSATANTSINAPITINGATDPAATAKAVKAELDKREREQGAARRAMMTDKMGY
jgi:TP901 family phage tail tape measure protein